MASKVGATRKIPRVRGVLAGSRLRTRTGDDRMTGRSRHSLPWSLGPISTVRIGVPAMTQQGGVLALYGSSYLSSAASDWRLR